jgi:hypothetical protein
MPPKTVALVGAVCVTIGWLMASMLSPPVARVQSLPERRAVPSTPPVEEFSELLHVNLRQAIPAPSVRRNPFVFGTRERSGASPATRAVAPALPPAVPPTMPPTPEGPALTLSGVGITVTSDGEVRTAVLSDGFAVHVVKAGDRVDGFIIGEVTDSTVTLTDASGAQRLLRLKE